jgi:hypothetical protein
MTFVERCARSPFVLSILFCLVAGLWWGSAQFAASSVANKVNHPAQPVTASPNKSLAVQGDGVSPHAFDWRKRGGNDAAYQRALARACQMPAASEPFGIGGVWASLGPDKPALADDPCQNLKSLTARGLLHQRGFVWRRRVVVGGVRTGIVARFGGGRLAACCARHNEYCCR